MRQAGHGASSHSADTEVGLKRIALFVVQIHARQLLEDILHSDGSGTSDVITRKHLNGARKVTGRDWALWKSVLGLHCRFQRALIFPLCDRDSCSQQQLEHHHAGLRSAPESPPLAHGTAGMLPRSIQKITTPVTET